jgi:FkbM family methyltransferase
VATILEHLLELLPTIRDHHKRNDCLYDFLKMVARQEVEKKFADREPKPKTFGPFGEITFPFFSMGAVDSLNLFDMDELILFSFYWINRNRYRTTADIGANIGLHTILLSKCGFGVRAYEPDPLHYSVLLRNLDLNNCPNVETFNMAVSNVTGEMEFVRVLGNTTGSHLSGSKANPYGDLERFPVKVVAIASIISWADLMKVDAEGHETQILTATKRADWLSTDALIEVENADNAAALFAHFRSQKVNMFSQKTGWRLVYELDGIPTSYKEGMLFVSCKDEMPW